MGESPTDELHQLVSQLGPTAEGAYMTTAEMLRAEGEARTRVSTLVELLTLKFGPLSPATLETIQAASTDQLKTWTTRVLTAPTLDEVLR